MNSSTQSFVLFSLGMILIIANAAQAEESVTVSLGVDLKKPAGAFCAELAIKNVCESVTPHRATCMEVMRSNPKMQAAKSFVQLSKLVLKVAVYKATHGQKFLQELAKTNNCSAIQQCAGPNYDGVIRSFKSSLESIKEDAASANYDAKVAADDVHMCESHLADAKIVNPAITQLNNEIKIMSAIAFTVGNNQNH
ncbi:hypothetical protein PIB30_074661 [Stylosanthes scabra]|uniref:Pectinesterase inhibitor domain-containing protein n=1 Tax=Stylosanthes scabra TaxID=79078 RepID=A0ABU6USI3_9FABA|nr:hypothetical protein [Stylosanthes scabra]